MHELQAMGLLTVPLTKYALYVSRMHLDGSLTMAVCFAIPSPEGHSLR